MLLPSFSASSCRLNFPFFLVLPSCELLSAQAVSFFNLPHLAWYMYYSYFLSAYCHSSYIVLNCHVSSVTLRLELHVFLADHYLPPSGYSSLPLICCCATLIRNCLTLLTLEFLVKPSVSNYSNYFSQIFDCFEKFLLTKIMYNFLK